MLSVLTTEEFDAWFQALDDAAAEEVATGIELIEALGPERAPPASSDLLLWYACPSGIESIDAGCDAPALRFLREVRGLLAHLASEPVQTRLRDVSDREARRVASAIEQIGTRIRWRDARSVEAARSDVRSRYRAVLAAAGLAEPRARPPREGLRQIDFLRRKPGLRVLYGVDNLAGRALLILGERLDQRAYGPSVRKALALWRSFLERAELAIEPADWSLR